MRKPRAENKKIKTTFCNRPESKERFGEIGRVITETPLPSCLLFRRAISLTGSDLWLGILLGETIKVPCAQTTLFSCLSRFQRSVVEPITVFPMAPSIATRVISPILLLAGTFLLGIAPIAVRRTLLNCGCDSDACKPSCRARKGKVVTSFLIYFGGGVLLATCLIHLLPEAREGFEHYNEQKESNDTPVTEPSILDQTLSTPLSTPRTLLNLSKEKEEESGHHEEFPIPEFVVCCGFFAVYLVEEIIHFFLGQGGHTHTHVPTETRAIRSLSRNNSCRSSSRPSVSDSFSNSFKQDKEPSTLHISAEKICEPETSKLSCAGFSVTGLLTVAALSFHSLFEGFAIGLQSSDSGLWILFAAVSVHKFVIAFVVGLEVLAAGGQDLLVIIYMSVFAAMSPLGMVIAMITQAEASAPLLVGVLNAIATGTLLYVTFCEILQREEEHNNLTGWQQFIATLLGFVVMCIVQYVTTLI